MLACPQPTNGRSLHLHALRTSARAPINIEGRDADRLDVAVFNFDPTLAPEGKTVVKVVFESDFNY
jgi:hypothetical protein